MSAFNNNSAFNCNDETVAHLASSAMDLNMDSSFEMSEEEFFDSVIPAQ